MLTHFAPKMGNMQLYMDAGMSSKNNRRLIDITKLAGILDDKVCQTLPGIHAFGGCDFTAGFYYKGKRKVMDMAEKKDEYLEAFKSLGEGPNIPFQVEEVLEIFTCNLCGQAGTKSVIKIRHI